MNEFIIFNMIHYINIKAKIFIIGLKVNIINTKIFNRKSNFLIQIIYFVFIRKYNHVKR